MQALWKSAEITLNFIKESKAIKWSEMNVDDLEDGAKKIMKMVKSCSKEVRWCNAFTCLDKAAKDFMNTVPLIQNLGKRKYIAVTDISYFHNVSAFECSYSSSSIISLYHYIKTTT